MTLPDALILNLPDAPDFISHPPRYTVSEMAALCEKMLPLWNAQRLASPPPPFVGEAFRLIESDPAPSEPVR